MPAIPRTKDRFALSLQELLDKKSIQDISVGIIVVAVSEVITIRDKEIVPPPDLDDGYSQKYMKGIGKVGDEVKLLLDCDRLINEDEIQDLN